MQHVRGQIAGTGRPSFCAISLSLGRPVSRSQSIRILIGCHASPWSTARRIAPSLAPPTQTGGCGDCFGRGVVWTFAKRTNGPS
jgi:hypothetical protein